MTAIGPPVGEFLQYQMPARPPAARPAAADAEMSSTGSRHGGRTVSPFCGPRAAALSRMSSPGRGQRPWYGDTIKATARQHPHRCQSPLIGAPATTSLGALVAVLSFSRSARLPNPTPTRRSAGNRDLGEHTRRSGARLFGLPAALPLWHSPPQTGALDRRANGEGGRVAEETLVPPMVHGRTGESSRFRNPLRRTPFGPAGCAARFRMSERFCIYSPLPAWPAGRSGVGRSISRPTLSPHRLDRT